LTALTEKESKEKGTGAFVLLCFFALIFLKKIDEFIILVALLEVVDFL